MWSTQTPLLRIVRPTGLIYLRFSPRVTVCFSWVRDTDTSAKSGQQMFGKKGTWWDIMRKFQENQLRGTERGGVQEIPSLNLHTKTGYRIQIVCCCLQFLFWNCKYRLRDFLSGVTSRLRSWPLYNLKQLTEQVMGRYRVFLVPWHRTWQHYRVRRIHPPGHPVTAAVLRRAIKEKQCLLYRLSHVTGCKQIASSQEKVASGERATVVSKICSPSRRCNPAYSSPVC